MIESEIYMFVSETYQINTTNLSLYELLRIIEMKDNVKYVFFKTQLRLNGWII